MTDDKGEKSGQDEVQVTVHPAPIDPPVAAFEASTSTVLVGSPVTFADKSSGEITQWTWSFDDGQSFTTASPTEASATHTYATAGTYTVKLTVSGPGGDDNTTTTILVEEPADDDGDIGNRSLPNFMEVGEVSIDHQGACVPFKNAYDDPIVVPGPLSGIGGDPAVVRVELNAVCGSDGPGFRIRVQEWDYLDEWHRSETVSYVVMERGTHLFGDTLVEAGRLETNKTNAFGRWNFADDTDYDDPANPFADYGTPVVLAAVTSVNEADAVTARVRKIDSTGFDIGMREQEKNTQNHLTESIDYIALEPFSDVINGVYVEVGQTSDAVTDGAYPLAFQAPKGEFDVPYLLAAMQTTDGGDTADLRWLDLYDSDGTLIGADIWVDEEQSRDSETRHTTEVVGHVVVAFPIQP